MLKRRTAILGTISLFPSPTLAQQENGAPPRQEQPDAHLDDQHLVPNELGRADFANAFNLEQTSGVALVAAVPDISEDVIGSLSDIRFGAASDIDRYFNGRFRMSFIQWFNQSVANRSEWAGKSVTAAAAATNFSIYWEQVLSTSDIGLFDFLAYMSVFINECDGNLVSVSEGFGSADHPGLSYLFDSFQIRSSNGRVWRKKSYNTGPLNRTVADLITDDLFNKTHGSLPPAEALRGSTDPVWDAADYPKGTMPTSADLKLTGYLQQADFFKFRGRGLIQTTWRVNYKKLVQRVVQYTGDSPLLQGYKKIWTGMDVDDVCTMSTDADWDRLFAEPSRFLLCGAVKQHSDDGRYLPLKANAFDLNGGGSGSLRFMGDRIGGTGYGLRLKARVRQICLAMS